MEVQESQELIEHAGLDREKNRTALVISIFAMMLALANLGGSNASEDAAIHNIFASNAYAFYQAKSIRQNDMKIASGMLELQLVQMPNMALEAQQAVRKKIAEFDQTAERYESEAETGKQALLAQARKHEALRDLALRQGPWFDSSEVLLQITIVLLSVSIIASIHALYYGGIVLGFFGFLTMLNGFFLLI